MILATIKRALGRLWTQLGSGSGTEGSDCGALTCINLIRWASHGKVGPKRWRPASHPDSVASWVRYVRRLANNGHGPMLVQGDILQVLNHPDLQRAFDRAGVSRMYANYHYGMRFVALRDYLLASDDHAAMLAIDYGVLRRGKAPMGSDSFSGGHAVALIGAQLRRTKVGRHYRMRCRTLVGDSLMDGRRLGIPRGYQDTLLYYYKQAAGAFGSAPDGSSRPIGQGYAICITVTRG